MQSTFFDAHVTLCPAQTPIVKNVATLTTMPEVEREDRALPMTITRGTGTLYASQQESLRIFLSKHAKRL